MPSDIDPEQTKEWLEALDSIIDNEGAERAQYILEQLFDRARRTGVGHVPFSATTLYQNTIPPHLEAKSDGDGGMEWKLRALIRWNAMAMVVQANREHPGQGGHIATYASAATLYEVGFNHFFRAANVAEKDPGDFLYIQGHSAPGIYARAFLEGRLSEEQLHNFRLEAFADGLSSYPHPWLMPNFWQFPTVSMGLGPIMAIYQAKFSRYLQDRHVIPENSNKIWAFLGDGETDEPESLGAIGLAGREKLDNLIFVINCNLQRLDGPVRGNGKIIQELEGVFRGAGWNVIKVVWGSYWDPLFAADKDGALLQRVTEAIDGDYQAFANMTGSEIREKFFGISPELQDLVSRMTDQDLERLNRGGHDPHKVFAAYHAATHHQGQPTVILAKTIKGYGLGPTTQAKMTSHSHKDMDIASLKAIRDHYDLPLTDDDLHEAPFIKPDADSPEMRYLHERREKMGGYLPARSAQAPLLAVPQLRAFAALFAGSGEREFSSTMAFVRVLSILLKDKAVGQHIVPIVPDEARTFGMEGLFRQLGIYSHVGQLYVPEDRAQLSYYRESSEGQMLEEGITEAGAMSSWIAAATAYANYGVSMVPFYVFYSMFGFQRIGDLAWAAGDSQARGFLIGATSGRTTLNGEGLQHEDGHSHIYSSVIPNCVSYDPTYAYEVAILIQDGMQKMVGEGRNIFYYLTLTNENYAHPEVELSDELVTAVTRGMHCISRGENAAVELLGCGAILNEVTAAADILRQSYAVDVNIWSVTSFTELAREGQLHDRQRLQGQSPASPYVSECLSVEGRPVVAATDYVQAFSEQIRPWLKGEYTTLGTDGYGRSDTREALREYFEVSRYHIVVAALQQVDPEKAAHARQAFNIRVEDTAPWQR